MKNGCPMVYLIFDESRSSAELYTLGVSAGGSLHMCMEE